MKELTDSIIHELFEKTGVDEKYYPYYETELKRRFYDHRKEFPYVEDEDEDERAIDEEEINSIITRADIYIKSYAIEREKGHCHQWANYVAKEKVFWEDDDRIYQGAYESIDSKEEKEKELEIHANSINSDPFFKEIYVYLFKEQDPAPQKSAEEYIRLYRECISNGKSEIYAKCYALRIVECGIREKISDLYASKYEECINKGRSEIAAKLIAHEYEYLYEKYWPEDDNILGIEGHKGYMEGFEYAIDNNIEYPEEYAKQYKEKYLAKHFPDNFFINDDGTHKFKSWKTKAKVEVSYDANTGVIQGIKNGQIPSGTHIVGGNGSFRFFGKGDYVLKITLDCLAAEKPIKHDCFIDVDNFLRKLKDSKGWGRNLPYKKLNELLYEKVEVITYDMDKDPFERAFYPVEYGESWITFLEDKFYDKL